MPHVKTENPRAHQAQRSRIPHPASRIPHPASKIQNPKSKIQNPAHLIPHPASRCQHGPTRQHANTDQHGPTRLQHGINTSTNTQKWAINTANTQKNKKSKSNRFAQQLELEKQRLALETKKFEFNAARQAICHLPELMKIVQDPKADSEDKIRAAREKLFGSAQLNLGMISARKLPLKSRISRREARLAGHPRG